jgi:hypothetical protein
MVFRRLASMETMRSRFGAPYDEALSVRQKTAVRHSSR